MSHATIFGVQALVRWLFWRGFALIVGTAAIYAAFRVYCPAAVTQPESL